MNLAHALTDRGTALKAAGDVAAGVAAYERALALCPRHTEALYNLAVALTEQGHTHRAIFMCAGGWQRGLHAWGLLLVVFCFRAAGSCVDLSSPTRLGGLPPLAL